MAESPMSGTPPEPEFEQTFPYTSGEQIVVNDISDVQSGTATPQVLAKLLDFAPLQVLLKDREGTYLFVNRLARRGLEVSGRDPIGMSDREATPISAQVDAWRRVEEACMNTGLINENEVTWTDLQNRDHINRVLNVPICDSGGTVIGVAVIAHDTTYKALVEASAHLMQLLQHDWVRNLLSGMINRIDGALRDPVQQKLSDGLGGYSLLELRKIFEFMESYLVSLPSVLAGYQSGNTRVQEVIELGGDVIQYMQELAPLINLDVRLDFDSSQSFALSADAKSLRVMCYELMRNHQKYGSGPSLLVKTTAIDDQYFRVDFLSPGTRHTDPTAYQQIGTKGKRFTTFDEEGNEKDPKGLGSGMYFCRTLALAHNGLTERHAEEFRGVVYGAAYNDILHANAFWFRFPRVAK